MASDLIPCPNCASTLRVPPGAAVIRCPKCKTVLAVEAPAAPPPPAAKAPPPLPFGKRPTAGPVAAFPTAAGAPTPAVPVAVPTAVRLAAVSTTDLDAPQQGMSAEEIEKRKQLRKALRKLEEKEEREKERFFVLRDECRWGRRGVTAFRVGCVGAMLSAMAFLGYAVTLLFTPQAWIIGIAAFGLLLHFGGMMTGYGCCVAGPKQVRAMATVGLIVTILQGMFTLGGGFALARDLDLTALRDRGVSDGELTVATFYRLGAGLNNLMVLAALPLLLASGLAKGFVTAAPVLGGVMEFAKLSLLGLLGNKLAAGGKAIELSHQSMRFVYRVFTALLLASIAFPMLLAFRLTGTGIVFSSIANGFLLWWSYAWLAQFNTLADIWIVVRADRYASNVADLDPN